MREFEEAGWKTEEEEGGKEEKEEEAESWKANIRAKKRHVPVVFDPWPNCPQCWFPRFVYFCIFLLNSAFALTKLPK